jgi:predicted Rossmann fold flavoprotein
MSGKQIVIAGCGAAGMAAAIAAAEQGARVTVIEKNEKAGKKIYITGKGRCNLTNAAGRDSFLEKIVTNPRFFYSAFSGFNNQDMMGFMEKSGFPVKIERGNRVFPVSDHASDVTRALTLRMQKLGVRVLLETEAVRPEITDGRIAGLLVRGRKGKEEREIPADALILATGGLSYPSTGSTGDGFRMAREAGHRVTELLPALVPLETEEDTSPMMGLSLKNVEVRMLDGKKEVYRGFGEMLFTHFGVSGPLILSASSFAAKRLRKHSLRLSIDLKPALTEEELDARILRDFDGEKNRDFANSLGHLLPAALIPEIVRRSNIPADRKVNAVTRAERRNLAALMKHVTYTVRASRGFGEAIITQGGVNCREINPSTMESKLVRGLYFAGEMIDLDAETGGFNLQIAWSTGHLAGMSAAAPEE